MVGMQMAGTYCGNGHGFGMELPIWEGVRWGSAGRISWRGFEQVEAAGGHFVSAEIGCAALV